MTPLTIHPNTLKEVFKKGEGGAFKPYGLFKFVTSEQEPTLLDIEGLASLPVGITMNPVSDFYTFHPTDKALYVFNLSNTSDLLVERSMT